MRRFNLKEQRQYTYYNSKFLREEPTKAELRLKRLLKRHKLKFRFQSQLENSIFDFCSRKHMVLIEVDGGYHQEEYQQIKDLKKNELAKRYKYRLLRFNNWDVLHNSWFVINQIKGFLK